jgi:hypothetical protein
MQALSGCAEHMPRLALHLKLWARYGQAAYASAGRSRPLRRVLDGEAAAEYLADAGALAAAGLGSDSGFLPPGTRCVLLQALRRLPPEARVRTPESGPCSQPKLVPAAPELELAGAAGSEQAPLPLKDTGNSVGADAGPGSGTRAEADMAGSVSHAGGVLVLASVRPRALSERERLWAAAVAAKLAAVGLPA